MQIPRFFIDSSSYNESVSAARIDDPKLVHQIARVLRLGAGAPVILLNGQGDLFHCRIEKQDRDSIALFIESIESENLDDIGELTVAMPLIKPTRFEWALEKLTELGATTIVPIIAQRTVQKSAGESEDGKKKDGKGGNVKQERWQTIVKEAAEQSERFAIPEVVAPQNFANYLKKILETSKSEECSNWSHYILAERIECPHLSMLLSTKKTNGALPKNISLCLGPEGGLTETELSRAAEAGLTFASLGKLILRSETAAVTAAAIISAIRNT